MNGGGRDANMADVQYEAASGRFLRMREGGRVRGYRDVHLEFELEVEEYAVVQAGEVRGIECVVVLPGVVDAVVICGVWELVRWRTAEYA